MPFSFHPDERRWILHIRAFGKITDAEWVDLLDRLSHEPSFVTGWPVLSDCSAVTAVLISSSLIESFAKSARTRHNLAAIIAPNPVVFGLSRMYQIFSVDIYIQHTAPTGHESNWLPAPTGNFILWLRVYLPGQTVLDGEYKMPPVVQVS